MNHIEDSSRVLSLTVQVEISSVDSLTVHSTKIIERSYQFQQIHVILLSQISVLPYNIFQLYILSPQLVCSWLGLDCGAFW